MNMKWQTLLDMPQLSLRLDKEDGSLLLEVNDGGMNPGYVTCRLQHDEVMELIKGLQVYEETMGDGSSH